MLATAERLRDKAELPIEIIAAAQTEDHAAFEAIFNQYHNPICKYIYRIMGGSPEDALDLTQDTFLQAYQALPRAEFATPEAVGSWLHRIATNVCIDQLRHRKLIRWQPWETFISRFHPSQVSNEGPEQAVLNKEKQQEIQLILDRLHPKYRMVLFLRGYQGLSYAEIAKVLNTTHSAVKSRLWYARKQFRQAYVYTRVQRQLVPI